MTETQKECNNCNALATSLNKKIERIKYLEYILKEELYYAALQRHNKNYIDFIDRQMGGERWMK